MQPLSAVSVKTAIDKDSTDLKELRIGDRIYLDVNISHSKEDSVELDKDFILNIQQNSNFALIDYGKETTVKENNTITKYDIRTAFFELGEQTIPSLKFSVFSKNDTTVVYSDSIGVQINSILSDDSTFQEIKDIAKPITISLTTWDIIFPIIVLILIAIIIIILLKRKSGKPIIPVKKKKEIPAHVIALRKLDELALANLLEQGKTKKFFVEISWICREYLEKRYGIPVLESTTSEIRNLLKKNDIAYNSKFHNLLLECDRVKYARFQKSIKEGKQILKDLKDLILKTKQKGIEDQDEDNIS